MLRQQGMAMTMAMDLGLLGWKGVEASRAGSAAGRGRGRGRGLGRGRGRGSAAPAANALPQNRTRTREVRPAERLDK